MIPQSQRVPLVTVKIAGQELNGFITLPWYQYINRDLSAAAARPAPPPVVLNLGGSGVAGGGLIAPGPRGPKGEAGRAAVFQTFNTVHQAPQIALGGRTSHGSYTPTLTNVTNLDASTAFACIYTVVGRVVSVSGRVDVDPTATGAARLGMSLPITSNFAAIGDCSGVAFASGGQGAAISADTSNDRADFNFTAIGAANISLHFFFQYKII